MKFLELIITSLLAAFDRFMDWISRGAWTRVRGSESSYVISFKEDRS